MLPKDKQTRLDFGSERASTEENQRKLLGLYRAFLYEQFVSAKTLRRWANQKILLEKMMEAYDPHLTTGGEDYFM